LEKNALTCLSRLLAAAMVAQPYPFTPSQHAELLHPPARHGGVVLARKLPEPPYWTEESWQPFELDMVLHNLAGKQDRYLTQSRLIGRRRAIAQLKELSAMWVDRDFYKVPKRTVSLGPEAFVKRGSEKEAETAKTNEGNEGASPE
jgi:hypothetical protein